MAHRLLLADDSITIQKVVELVLAEEDFEIKAVNNGDEALGQMDSFRPDIVLADIDMPKMNGYQLCEKIKQNPATAHIPVILLAGAFEPIDEELARHVGSDDSVIKPFESQELISKINAALMMASAGEMEAPAAEAAEEEAEEALAVEDTAEEAEEAVAVGESGGEEDLWAMEDLVEPAAPAEELSDEIFSEELAEPVAFSEPADEEAFEVADEETTPGMPGIAAAAAVSEDVRPAAPAAMDWPSRAEMMAEFRKVAEVRIASFLESSDFRAELMAQMAAPMKDAIEKVLWEIAPELSEKVLKEILQGAVGSLSSQVEKVLWETVPDLAGTMIAKEIERIRSEF